MGFTLPRPHFEIFEYRVLDLGGASDRSGKEGHTTSSFRKSVTGYCFPSTNPERGFPGFDSLFECWTLDPARFLVTNPGNARWGHRAYKVLLTGLEQENRWVRSGNRANKIGRSMVVGKPL